MAPENDSVPTQEEIRRQLSRMLSGEHFSANENPARFLAFVVERALQNEPITQAIIGFELFPGKYARTEIPDVRVTARNLRMVLAKYYAHEGAEDLVLIKLPTPPGANKPKLPPGKAYKPVFSYNPGSPAHKEYSQGLYMLSQSRLTQAEKHFARAIELQPRYWEPYLGLATAYLLCSIRAGVQDIGEDSFSSDYIKFGSSLPVIRSRVAQALAINRKHWRIHVIRGVVHTYQHQWEKARRAFAAALRMSPEKTRDDPWYIAYLATTGRLDEAIVILRARIKNDPNDASALTQYGLLMYVARRLYEADEAFTRAYRLDGRYWPARIGRVLVMLELVTQEKEMDQGDAALSEMQLLRRESGPFANYFPGLLVLCLARTGNTEEARRQLEIFTMPPAMDPVQKALAYLGLGETDQAVLSLHAAFAHSDPLLLWLHLWPVFNPLRGHKRFQELIRRMNLPASK
jgi:tetratricopeptide (TPR) repeat protein